MSRIYAMMFFSLFCSTSLMSQQLVENVNITGVRMEVCDEGLRVDFDVSVSPRSVTKCQSLTIIPEISTHDRDNSLKLPSIRVNGKNMIQMDNRMKKLNRQEWEANGRPLISLTATSDTTFKYAHIVTYSQWMDGASLAFVQILAMCDNTQQGYRVVTNSIKVAKKQVKAYEMKISPSFIAPVRTAKLHNLEGKAYIDFAVGKTTLDPYLGNNAEELDKICAEFEKVVPDKDITIEGVYINGYSSPEGTYGGNASISLKRAISLKDYLRGKFGVPDSKFHVKSSGEDWNGLLQILDISHLSYGDNAIAIIKNVSDIGIRKARLQLIANGTAWRHMMSEIFPKLRRVEYRINYTVKDYGWDEVPSIIERNPELLNPYEIFTLAEHYGSDKDSYVDLMLLSLRLYPDDIAVNINAAGALLMRGDTAGAKKLLDKVQGESGAYNNLGVYYMLTGDLIRAEQCLQKAADLGIPEATKNLAELRIKQKDNALIGNSNQ